MADDTNELLAETEQVLAGSGVASVTVDMMETLVSTYGWQRVLGDLATVAERRKNGRAFGVLVAAQEFIAK